MPKRNLRALVASAVAVVALTAIDASAQEIQPLGPVIEPADPGRTEDGAEGPEPALIPLPAAANRTAAAADDRVRVTTVLPASWNGIVSGYQPLWTGVLSPHGFGLHRWTAYFAASTVAPVLTPHPFFGPWGVLAYDAWILDRYRATWATSRTSDRFADAAAALQAADRAIIEGRPVDAAAAYRAVTQAAPDFPLAYLGLGAALMEIGEDDDAALAFRQSLDRYPAWLALTVDWSLFYGRQERLRTVEEAAMERAAVGSASARFATGMLHLFGTEPERGRQLLRTLEGDPHAKNLLLRGPR